MIHSFKALTKHYYPNKDDTEKSFPEYIPVAMLISTL